MFNLYLLSSSEKVFNQVDKDMNVKGVQIHTSSMTFNWLESQPYWMKAVIFVVLLMLVCTEIMILAHLVKSTVQELEQVKAEQLKHELNGTDKKV